MSHLLRRALTSVSMSGATMGAASVVVAGQSQAQVAHNEAHQEPITVLPDNYEEPLRFRSVDRYASIRSDESVLANSTNSNIIMIEKLQRFIDEPATEDEIEDTVGRLMSSETHVQSLPPAMRSLTLHHSNPPTSEYYELGARILRRNPEVGRVFAKTLQEELFDMESFARVGSSLLTDSHTSQTCSHTHLTTEPVSREWLVLQQRHSCPCCEDVILRPYVNSCGHSFCAECVGAIPTTNPNPSGRVFGCCPECEEPIDTDALTFEQKYDHTILTEVMSLSGQCPEKMRWVTRRKLLDNQSGDSAKRGFLGLGSFTENVLMGVVAVIVMLIALARR